MKQKEAPHFVLEN